MNRRDFFSCAAGAVVAAPLIRADEPSVSVSIEGPKLLDVFVEAAGKALSDGRVDYLIALRYPPTR